MRPALALALYASSLAGSALNAQQPRNWGAQRKAKGLSDRPLRRRQKGVHMKLGRYGQLHREQLQRSLPEVYRQLQREGKLAKHLQAVDQSADRMRALLLKQLAEKRPYDPVEWKNSREAWEGYLERVAEELVLEDRVYVPMPDPDGEGP